MIIFNIHANGPSSQLIVELIDDEVYIEPSVVAYVAGDIKLDATVGSTAHKMTAYFIGKKYFRPVFKGTGKIYLKPTLGNYHKLTVNDKNKLIINNNAFIACRTAIKVSPQISPSLSKFLSGTPIINNLTQGNGNIMIHMTGQIIEEKLDNSTFVAYDSNIAAYSKELKVTRTSAGKGWLNIAHKTVNVYKGTGSVFFTAHPNKDAKHI